MKQALEEHLKEISKHLKLEVKFETFDCQNDQMPDWTKDIVMTNEFFVCCKDLSIKQRLETVTGRTIFNLNNFIYWFEGENIVEYQYSDCEVDQLKEKKIIESFKKETRLPTFLDQFIFNKLGAIYAPNFQRFDYNLDLNTDEVLKYLGTYFPRSYSESFCIFDNIFQNTDYYKSIIKKEQIDILSVGCGTGGDIIGLLTIIEKYCDFVNQVNIIAIDGNKDALLILSEIVDRFRVHTSKSIHLKCIETLISSIPCIKLEDIEFKKFDFITSFKFVCEIIAMGKGTLDNSYLEFVHKFVPMLSKIGLCVLLDVTTKLDHTAYNPILMNRQVRQSLKDLKEFKILVPTSCSLYCENCYNDCFHQQIFYISHQGRKNDKSKVVYRIIGHNNLVDTILKRKNNIKLLVAKDKYCLYTLEYDKIGDAYSLE